LLPEWVSTGKRDDSIFREYIVTHEPQIPALNLYPNIVDHIDYLLGGSVINAQERAENPYRKSYWRSPELDEAVAQLEEQLKKRGV